MTQLDLFEDTETDMPQGDVVELFAGAGGMSLGAHAAELTTVGIEWWGESVKTRLANGLATVHGDVRDYGPLDFPSARVLAGGPPCQTFSITGNGAGRRQLDEVLRAISHMAIGQFPKRDAFDDDRTSLVLEPLRWALKAHNSRRSYEAIVLEQVPAALPVWDAYAVVLRRLGYSAVTGVLRTEQYGLPQTRKRAVLIARRDGQAKLPEPTHRAYRKGVSQSEGDQSLRPWVAMGDVVRRHTWFEVVSNYGTGGDPKNRGRRRYNEPSATVTGKIFRNRLVDRWENDLPRFGPDAAGRLQGFPEDYVWAGNDVAQQIGNACPVPLAEALFRSAIS